MGNIKITIDKKNVSLRISAASRRATEIVATQALKDCNDYCKHDQGILIASSLSSSELTKGLLVWDTPYAKRQYYLDNTNNNINPNAQKMWCEKARTVKGKNWQNVYQEAFERFMEKG